MYAKPKKSKMHLFFYNCDVYTIYILSLNVLFIFVVNVSFLFRDAWWYEFLSAEIYLCHVISNKNLICMKLTGKKYIHEIESLNHESFQNFLLSLVNNFII